MESWEEVSKTKKKTQLRSLSVCEDGRRLDKTFIDEIFYTFRLDSRSLVGTF